MTVERPLFYYADDDEDDHQFLKIALDEVLPHVDVVPFSDGFSLLETLSSNDGLRLPDLIILDINMPLKSGKEVLSELREMEHLQNLKVVLFTNSSLPADETFASKYNAAFRIKPLEYNHFKEAAVYFAELIRENG